MNDMIVEARLNKNNRRERGEMGEGGVNMVKVHNRLD